MIPRLSILFFLAALVGCGSDRGVIPPDQFVIDTYLATPDPGQASRAQAARRCRARALDHRYVETRGNGRGGFRHVFECAPFGTGP